MIYGALYALSAGASHTAQYALAAIFKAVNDGTYNYISEVREYGEKARHYEGLVPEVWISDCL